MVPKLSLAQKEIMGRFRAVLFRMVPKHYIFDVLLAISFRAVLFRMVPKHIKSYSFFK